MNGAANYYVRELLLDGAPILIRAIRPDDKQRLLHHFQRLSPQSVYYRFFGFKRSLTDDDLHHLTELDFINRVGLVATMGCGEGEWFIGVGHYIRSGDRSCAEVAFAVLDEYQGHGVGTLLLKHLAKIAQANGIRRFVADVMGGNHKMLEVFTNSGFVEHKSYQPGVMRIALEIGVGES
jgi:GNAT superfamily N-acetyltransferase